MVKLTIVQDGQTRSGKPCLYLDCEDSDVDQNGNQIEPGEHFTVGWFSNEEECRQWAEKNGHEIDEE